MNTGRSVLIRKGGTAASHATHGPDPEEVTTLRIMGNMKRQAAEQVGRPLTAIMRQATEAITSVQARLPAAENIRKSLLYERAKDLPPNPTTIDELQELPDRFKRKLVGENFLIYDSFEDEDYALPCGRIIVFATLANLKIFFKSNIWGLAVFTAVVAKNADETALTNAATNPVKFSSHVSPIPFFYFCYIIFASINVNLCIRFIVALKYM